MTILRNRRHDLPWVAIFASVCYFLVGPFGAFITSTSLDERPISIIASTGSTAALANSPWSYQIRLFLIVVAMLFALIGASKNLRRIRIRFSSLGAILIFCICYLIGIVVHPESFVITMLQVSGVLVWIIFGIMIASSVQNIKDAIVALIIGYLGANLIYAAYTGLYALLKIGESIHSYTGRLIGPFQGSTVLSEVVFSLILFGFLMFKKGWQIIGLTFSIIGLWLTFLTGVRSASVVSLLIVLFLFTQLWRTRLHSIKRQPIGQIVLLTIALCSCIYVSLKSGILINRLNYEDILAGSRLEIWKFGIDSFLNGSILLGTGMRAVFSYGVSTEGPVLSSTIAWHNTWLSLLVEVGILGFVSYLLILSKGIVFFLKPLRRLVKGRDYFSVYMLIGAFIAIRYIIMSFTEMNLYLALSPGVMFFSAIFGILSISLERTKQFAVLKEPYM